MPWDVSLGRTTAVIVLAGCALAVAPFLDFSPQAWGFAPDTGQTLRRDTRDTPPLASDAIAFDGQEKTNVGLPVRLLIPKIGVNAAVESVGVASDGSMEVPKSPDGVAWFGLGARPGERGGAAIAGHYGWKGGKPSVFDDLYTLRKGDRLYVEDETGATITFVVNRMRRYRPEADAAEVFGSYDGKAHLNLITCEGVWNNTAKSYSHRLVVFADKE